MKKKMCVCVCLYTEIDIQREDKSTELLWTAVPNKHAIKVPVQYAKFNISRTFLDCCASTLPINILYMHRKVYSKGICWQSSKLLPFSYPADPDIPSPGRWSVRETDRERERERERSQSDGAGVWW